MQIIELGLRPCLKERNEPLDVPKALRFIAMPNGIQIKGEVLNVTFDLWGVTGSD